MAKNLNMLIDVSMKDSSNTESFVSSPFTLPPYDSLAPIPLTDNNNSPPFCVYPPPNPQSPDTTSPSPFDYSPTPPSSPTESIPTPNTPETYPSPTIITPGPPESFSSPPIITPGPPESFPSPPIITPGTPEYATSPPFDEPSPPYYEPSPPSGDNPSPPEDVPSPIGFEPSPPVFEPPVVYPPPTTPPPSRSKGHGSGSVWCVAKPSVPDPIIQEAMNYACASGADCDPLQTNGQCYQPNTILAHASYAFNSYWQRTKVAGGTCSFGGIAILVTVDPSSQGCRFDSV
ncbi:hypothetical protein BVRB_7g162560 [Beta vulgaris subsp. vulgaris]|nr:hypothetical protein BVRB_7g162560 [Beta vulgaris subsp. vulgaris]